MGKGLLVKWDAAKLNADTGSKDHTKAKYIGGTIVGVAVDDDGLPVLGVKWNDDKEKSGGYEAVNPMGSDWKFDMKS